MMQIKSFERYYNDNEDSLLNETMGGQFDITNEKRIEINQE